MGLMENRILQQYRQQLSLQELNMEHKIRLDHALKVKDILYHIKNIMKGFPSDGNLTWVYEGDRMEKMITMVRGNITLFEADTNKTITHFSDLSKQLGKQSALHQIKARGK